MEPLSLEAYVKDKLDEIQSSLLGRATSFRDRCIFYSQHFCISFACWYYQMHMSFQHLQNIFTLKN